MRLIDADVFLQAQIRRCHCIPLVGSSDKDYESLKLLLDQTPTVYAVAHGRWEKHLAPYTDDYWSCTCCNGNFMTDAAQYWKYCPNCGAKMDKED